MSWTGEDLGKALKLANEGNVSVRSAAKKFGKVR